MLNSFNPTLIFASIFSAMMRRGIPFPGAVERTVLAFLEQQLGVGTDFRFDEVHTPATHESLKAVLKSLGIKAKQDAGFLHVIIPEIFGNFTTVSYLLSVVVAPNTEFYRVWAQSVLSQDRMELSLKSMPVAWITVLRADRAALLAGEVMPLVTLLSRGSAQLQPPGWLRVMAAEIWSYEHQLQVEAAVRELWRANNKIKRGRRDQAHAI